MKEFISVISATLAVIITLFVISCFIINNKLKEIHADLIRIEKRLDK